jgi:signal transduction histidine kinase
MVRKLKVFPRKLHNLMDSVKISIRFAPFSVRTPLRLMKINSALLVAGNEQEMLAAIGQSLDDEVELRLLYMESKKDGKAGSGTIVASWRDGVAWADDPARNQVFAIENYQIMQKLESMEDAVLFLEDLSVLKQEYPGCDLLKTAKRAALVKVYSLRDDYLWQAMICITWSEAGQFLPDEEFIYRGISQTASAVISNYRLRLEALQNVERLRELDKLKNQFLYSVSHELRTPLGGIISAADFVLQGVDGEINDDVRTEVQMIFDSGEHLLEMINEILDLAKIEAGTLNLNREPNKIEDTLIESVRTVQSLASAKHLLLDLKLDADLPLINMDCKRIRQVVINLLSNAIKFSDQGTIRIRACIKDADLVVSVQDEGIGILMKDQAIVFEAFRRSQTGLKQDGTGLGLPISKRLIELHGGRIWLESQIGQGTIVQFSLPTIGGRK